jgi:hypothetical protein
MAGIGRTTVSGCFSKARHGFSRIYAGQSALSAIGGGNTGNGAGIRLTVTNSAAVVMFLALKR